VGTLAVVTRAALAVLPVLVVGSALLRAAPSGPAATNGAPPQTIEGIAEVREIREGSDPAYRIGVEDLLLVSVWREPELTREVPVRPDGKISLPLVQDVHAADRTPSELGQEIRRRLEEFLTSPTVNVVVREVNSLKVYLLGEVVRPGPVNLRSQMRLLQAISMAGGVTPFGGRNGVVIYRKLQSGEKVLKVSYRDIVSGKAPEDNLMLQPDDTVVVQ
jgi:polysaccharide export outer membrane protein